MEHNQIESLLFYDDPSTGDVIVCDITDPANLSKHAVAFGPRVTVDPKLSRLLAAAPVMYQTLSKQYLYLQAQIEVIERLPRSGELETLLSSLVEAQNGILTAQRVAQVGYEKVANSIDKDSKRS